MVQRGDWARDRLPHEDAAAVVPMARAELVRAAWGGWGGEGAGCGGQMASAERADVVREVGDGVVGDGVDPALPQLLAQLLARAQAGFAQPPQVRARGAAPPRPPRGRKRAPPRPPRARAGGSSAPTATGARGGQLRPGCCGCTCGGALPAAMSARAGERAPPRCGHGRASSSPASARREAGAWREGGTGSLSAWPHLAERERSKRIGLEKGILDVYIDRAHM
jgi:hypothetical protein